MRIFSQGWSNGFDGPGRRWVYYLKGCNFSCLWCGNPESISMKNQMLFYPEKSSFAAESCPNGAVLENGKLDREKCIKCSSCDCVNSWHDPAFELSGKDISVSELIEEVMSRRDLFGSDGGVTFSGGEPTLQMDELLEAALALKKLGINLAIETNASSRRFSELNEIFDTLICDLKCVSPELHRLMVSFDNQTVIKNLMAVRGEIIRIPLIEELNFVSKEQDKILGFLTKTSPKRVELLRLHQLGLPKYKALGISCRAEFMQPPKRKDAETFAGRIMDLGINCKVLN